jgi:hypothetical protein
VALGDSVTFGLEVPIEQTYPKVLERELLNHGRAAVEVINAGVPGYGTRQELAWLRAYGVRLSPDLVILGFFVGNDVLDNRMTPDEKLRLLGLAAGGYERRRFTSDEPGRIWAPRPVKRFLRDHSVLYLYIATAFNNVLDAFGFTASPDAAHPPGDWQETLDLVRRTRAAATSAGATTLLVILPVESQVHHGWLRGYRASDGPQRILLAACEREGLVCVDLLPRFRADAHPSELFTAPGGGHLTSRGHLLAATAIFEAVQREMKERVRND